MRVCLTPPATHSRSLARIADGLARHLPGGVSVVLSPADADLVVLFVIGRLHATIRAVAEAERRGQRVAVVQCCLRSTKEPSAAAWLPVWRRASVVWSYLDLSELCLEERVPSDFAFYHAPLGSDPEVFRGRRTGRAAYTVATSGLSWMTEGVRECVTAARELGGSVFHLGPDMGRDGMTCASGIGDAALADTYSRCEYVSGLRRIEGFELPALEGLLCGARPVLFDRPHYRRWYGEHGEYVSERSRPEVVSDLVALFGRRPRRVSAAEVRAVAAAFAWRGIASGFWERAL